jgi:hypothetical protein
MTIHMGYMGWAKIGTTTVKITSSSINPVQAIEAPELVQGDYVKKAMNYGKIETGGNIAGPIAETSVGFLWTYATTRTTDGDKMNASVDIEIMYYKGGGRKFSDCQLNSFQISVTAGDVAQYTIDFMGTTASALSGGSVGTVNCEKLVTWDKCSFSGGGIPDDQIQSFSLTVGNGLQRIYKLNTGNLFPAEILAGMQDVTGNVSFYADSPVDTMLPVNTGGSSDGYGADSWDDYTAAANALTFVAGPITASANVMFARPEANAQTGPAIYTVAFTGVCTATV